MLPTALAMALRHPFSLASGDKAHRAAETATLEAITHLSALEFRSPMVPGLRFTGLHCTLVLKSDELINKLATVPEIEPAELVKLAPKGKDTLRAGEVLLFEILQAFLGDGVAEVNSAAIPGRGLSGVVRSTANTCPAEESGVESRPQP
jgi:hypothetical protein